MLEAITDSLGHFIDLISIFVKSLVGSSDINVASRIDALLPLFAIGVGISVIIFAIKAIKGSIWGS